MYSDDESSSILAVPDPNSNVLDLPYVVLRHIFSYLSDRDIYFNVRGVCRQLRGYVEDYIQIGNIIFMLEQ